MPKPDRYPYSPKDASTSFYGIRTRNFRRTVLAAIEKTQGPIVEVHGPNRVGYAGLGSGKLPKPLIITSPDTSKPHVQQAANVHEWPFKNGSIGTIINCGMPSGARDRPFDSHVADEVFNRSDFKQESQWTIAGLVQRRLDAYLLTSDDIGLREQAWQNPDIMRRAPAFQLLAAARRSLELGGILLKRSIYRTEAFAALELGFTPLPNAFLEPPNVIHEMFQ